VTLAELNKMEDITNMNILSFAPTCLLGIVNIVTWLTWLLNWQNAPKNNGDLWSDFCVQRMWKLVEFTKEWVLNMAITVWARGKSTNEWKDSNEGGQVIMCVLGGHRLQTY